MLSFRRALKDGIRKRRAKARRHWTEFEDMAVVNILDKNGGAVGTLELRDAVFAVEVNKHSIRAAINNYRANQRLGTSSTKTRGEVSGGGRKPWRQKGTGRARAGSTRSPLWRGGAIVFGPKPRSYDYHINKKTKRLALRSALTSKREENRLFVLDSLDLGEAKTKQVVEVLTKLKIEGKTLFLTDGVNEKLFLAARNLPSVTVSVAENINVYDLLRHDNLVTTPGCLKKLEEWFA
jgi:large subunit ribosomal protein L4